MTQTLTQQIGHEHAQCAHDHVPHELPTDVIHDSGSPESVSRAWQVAAVAGNLAIGVAELVASGNTGLMTLAADGAHKLGDMSYGIQAEAARRAVSEERRAKLRKISHWIIASVSLGASIRAGTSLALEQDSAIDPSAIYTAGASLALNGLLLSRLWIGIRRRVRHDGDAKPTVDERHLLAHVAEVDLPSAAMAVGGVVLAGFGLPQIEQVAGVISGLWGAYRFRPTTANLADDHSHDAHGHTHEHKDVNPVLPSRHAHKSWLGRIRYKPMHQKGWSSRMAYDPAHRREQDHSVMPLAHPWTYHPRNYKRDVLQRIQQNGERPGVKASVRAIGKLLLRPAV